MANLIKSLIYVHNLPETFFVYSRSEKMEMFFFLSFHRSEHLSQTAYLWFLLLIELFSIPCVLSLHWELNHCLRNMIHCSNCPPTPPPAHSVPRTWQPCPIQTCALLHFIVGHKWMVRLSTLEASVTHQALYNITSQGKSQTFHNPVFQHQNSRAESYQKASGGNLKGNSGSFYGFK